MLTNTQKLFKDICFHEGIIMTDKDMNMTIDELEIDLTNFCPLGCKGCPSLLHKTKQQLDWKNPLEILSPKSIVVCGNNGDPLLHPDITQIINDCSKHPTHISTNGQYIDKLDLDKLKNNQNLHFEISVDGPTNEIHRLTRTNGDLNVVLKNVQTMLGGDCNVSLVYSRHRDNENYCKETYDMIKDRCGIELDFRDTTIITDEIKPPSYIGQNTDVSVLYKPLTRKISVEQPIGRDNLYVRYDGMCYPCVWLSEIDDIETINIYDYSDKIEFMRDYFIIVKQLCNKYNHRCDRRKCLTECSIYQYKGYDNLNTIKGNQNEN